MASILVIDDDVEILEMLRLLLEKREGHEVLLSASGKDGLSKAIDHPPDLAIVDIMMPDITGFEVCRRLREEPKTASVPILVLTARGHSVDREAALNMGADAYLSKPVTTQELAAQVNELLEQHVASKPSPDARSIAMLSLKGGVGVTTLVVNMAASLTQTRGGGVCLVDLCPASGHAALQLGLRPQPNWSRLAQNDQPSLKEIERCLLPHRSGLQLLASPMVPPTEEHLTRARVDHLLQSLQHQFATLVIDTPSILNEATSAVLDAASVIGIVATAEPASIQTTIGTLRSLKPWSDKLQIILNQPRPGLQISADALARIFKQPPLTTMPFDQKQNQALSQGKPLALSTPDSAFAKAIRALPWKMLRP